MSEMTEFKIYQLNGQLERLTHTIDKICERVEKIEKESFEKTIYKKFLSFLYLLYPGIMMFLLALMNSKNEKVNDLYAANMDVLSTIMQHIIF